jgi:hypothetical protein
VRVHCALVARGLHPHDNIRQRAVIHTESDRLARRRLSGRWKHSCDRRHQFREHEATRRQTQSAAGSNASEQPGPERPCRHERRACALNTYQAPHHAELTLRRLACRSASLLASAAHPAPSRRPACVQSRSRLAAASSMKTPRPPATGQSGSKQALYSDQRKASQCSECGLVLRSRGHPC